MATIGVDLRQLTADAANQYMSSNAETFKSTVPGPQGPQGPQGVKGDTGEKGDSLTLTNAVNNGDGTFTLTFSDGSTHTTQDLRGQDGADGQDGLSVTVGSVTFAEDTSMTIEFSDGTITTSPSLRGVPGRSIHHIVHTSSLTPTGEMPAIGYGGMFEEEVEPGVPGNIDRYTVYLDEEENYHIGTFETRNGDSAYAYAVDGGFTGTPEEFIATLGLIDDLVDAAQNAIAAAEAARDKAEQWAEEDEDVEVEPGEYSSKHWAAKAKTAKDAAIVAQGLAETAQGLSEDARDAAIAAKLSAELLFDQFGDQYLGTHASDPTTDNDGDPLDVGDVYWNSTESVLKFYNGTAWVAPEAVASTAAADALTAQTAAETAQGLAEDAQTAAENARDEAQLAQTGAETAEANAASSEAYVASVAGNVDVLIEAISNVSSAGAYITSTGSTVIGTSPVQLGMAIVTQSTNTDVLEVNADNTITFKEPGNYNFLSTLTISSNTNSTVNAQFQLVDVSDESVVTTQQAQLDIANGTSDIISLNTFVVTGVVDAPLTIKVLASADITGMTLDSYTSVLSGGVSGHGALVGRNLADQHPASAISTTMDGKLPAGEVQSVLAGILNGTITEEV